MYYYYKIQQKGRDIRRIPKHEDKLLTLMHHSHFPRVSNPLKNYHTCGSIAD
jgi:hypothetical protein